MDPVDNRRCAPLSHGEGAHIFRLTERALPPADTGWIGFFWSCRFFRIAFRRCAFNRSTFLGCGFVGRGFFCCLHSRLLVVALRAAGFTAWLLVASAPSASAFFAPDR